MNKQFHISRGREVVVLGEVNMTQDGLGMQVFDSYRAEEEPWLPQVFEPPPEFDLISGPRSAIIFGESGSGKTAVFQALVKESLKPDGSPIRLVVPWRPPLPKTAAEANSEFVEKKQLAEILNVCALKTVAYLVHYPEVFSNAPSWIQGTLVWFVRRYLQGDFELRTGRLTKEIGEAGQKLLTFLANAEVRDVLQPEAAPELVLAELIQVLEDIGLEGVWIMVDSMGPRSESDPERLIAGLTAFLSSLNLFEQTGFAYKILLPDTLSGSLSKVSGIERRRVERHRLHWTRDKLVTLVEKRLALAFGGRVKSLAHICEDKTLPQWLERCAGLSPLEWVEQMRPLVAAYLDQTKAGVFEPISTEQWREIRRRRPPQLVLDKENKRVIIGGHEVAELSAGQYEFLEYMYDRANKVCTRSELYYLAYLRLDNVPRSNTDKHWEAPKRMSSVLDTAIWRLREAIEPDPKDPIFINTVKTKGYRLENTNV